MQARRLLLWSALAIMAGTSLAHAQPNARWQTTLEGAKRVAAQNNQLVLVHFWAPYCTACRRMEQEVFPDPAVTAAIQTYYVPVKINTEYFPATATQFGITALPTDVVVSAQGQVLARFEGMLSAPDYSARLCQLATSARTQSPAAVYAQIPAGQPASAAAQPNMTRPSQPMPVAAPMAAPMNGAPMAAAPASPYAGMMPAQAMPPQGVQAPVDPAMAPQGVQTPAGAPIQAVAQPSGTSAPASGSPPLAMDGFCPVRLVETQKWTLGDSRWGVIHQGRTYLFAGPDEQSKFYARPDVYAPVMSGNDVVLALETGRIVPGDRRHGVYYGNHIYLFTTEESLQKFEREPDRYAGAAQQILRATAYSPTR